MAIDPTTTTTIRVGQLGSAAFNSTDLVPHEVSGTLKKGTLQDLATFIGSIISVDVSVGFRAVQVNDGETLPATDQQEFILVGPGTYPNVGGGATITTTGALNALVSNGVFWFIGVEIPIEVNAIWGDINGVLSDQTDLNDILVAKADLVGGKVPNSQLPSYVDDVIEVNDYASLPGTGETGKIYVTKDTGNIYRWSGSAYIRIADESPVWGIITGTLSDQTDLQNALDGKFDVPTGDTTQYIAGDGSLVTFPIAGQAGTLVRLVLNNSGSTIAKGSVVYINGASGNKPTIAKAIATGDSTSAQTFGLLQSDISNNANGYVVVLGDLIGLDTSGITEGTQLYLSSTVAGAYTTTKQVAPAHLVYIGVVTRSHPTQGQIEVKIQNGYELDEIHDVSITSKANNQFLVYESASNLWKNKSLSTILGGTSSQFLKGDGSLDSTAYVPTARTLTINGTAYDLSANRSWTIPTHDAVTIGTANGLSLSGQVLSLGLASSSANGALSSTDWNTFNSKLSSLSGAVLTTTDQDVAGIKNFTESIKIQDDIYLYKESSYTIKAGYTTLTATALDSLVIAPSVTKQGILSFTNLTEPKIFYFPNTEGTIALTSDLHSAVTIGTANGLSLSGQALSLSLASTSTTGALSSTDWNTFNGKQNAITNLIDGIVLAGYIPKSTLSTSGLTTLGNSAIYEDTNGNIGLGISSPNYSTSTRRVIDINGTSQAMLALSVGGVGKGFLFHTGTDLLVSNEGNGAVKFNTNGSEKVIITSGGNVGIGTTSPSYILQTKAGSGFVGAAFSSSYAATSIIGNDANSSWFGQGTNGLGSAYVINNTSGYAQIELGGSPRFFVNSSGNVGIGTISPTSKLHLYDNATVYLDLESASASSLVRLKGGTYSGFSSLSSGVNQWFVSGGGASQTLVLGTADTERMRITSSGNVGIGTTSPSYTLHVNGSVAGTSAYVNLSDKRHKKDILPIENALDKILALNGVTFNWDKESTDMNLDDNNHIGLIAQDVEKIIPQAVVTAQDENKTKSVAYTDLVPVLIEAIKELKAEIEILKNK